VMHLFISYNEIFLLNKSFINYSIALYRIIAFGAFKS